METEEAELLGRSLVDLGIVIFRLGIVLVLLGVGIVSSLATILFLVFGAGWFAKELGVW